MKSKKTLLVAALCGALLIGALGVSGCSNKNTVAKVNGEAITTETLNAAARAAQEAVPQHVHRC